MVNDTNTCKTNKRHPTKQKKFIERVVLFDGRSFQLTGMSCRLTHVGYNKNDRKEIWTSKEEECLM